MIDYAEGLAGIEPGPGPPRGRGRRLDLMGTLMELVAGDATDILLVIGTDDRDALATPHGSVPTCR